ncbi:MAG: hypothetical protein K2N90_11740 [Lachnospiraceae bacterium]|nr:hypothetical protein [Lachnospiraceae bacterium]
MSRKIAYVFSALAACAVISGCSGEDVSSDHAETEVAAVTRTETGETVTECVANEQQDFEESLYEYTAELDEIPELRYRNISNLEYRLGNYICHNDTLILGTTIYKKEGETYVRQELTLNAIFDTDEDLGMWDTDDVESELLSRRLADGVSFYDYEGNQKGFYPMGNKALLEQGYYLTKLTYNEGQLTGFYVQRDTDELYISQITLEGNNNMAEYENIRKFFQNDYMDLEAHAKYQDGEEWVEATVFAEWYLVKRYDKGSVYRFKVQPLSELTHDRLNTYFYATDHEIYRIFGWAWQDEESITFYDNDELLIQILDTDEKLKNNGYIVCQNQNMSGQLEHGETGWYTICQEQAGQENDSATWHFNVHKWKNEIVCDSRIIRVNGERDYYETFVWENGKGLTEFCSGYRVERDILYLTEISETVVEG